MSEDFTTRKVEGSKVFKMYLAHMRETIAEMLARESSADVAEAVVTQSSLARTSYYMGVSDAYKGIAEAVEGGFNAYYARGQGLIAVAPSCDDDMTATLKFLREMAQFSR